MLGVLLAVVLSQATPVCGVNMTCSYGGYLSRAGEMFGSGTPDFICGNPDDGTSEHSKYCLFVSRTNPLYRATHGDFTFMGDQPRYAGLLLQLMNQAYGSQSMFSVDFAGTMFSYGKGLEVQQNGAGLRSKYSYVGIRGASTTPGVIADVLVTSTYGHRDGGYVFDVWNGPEAVFRVRDDGVLNLGSKLYRFSLATMADGGEALRFTHERPDGGLVEFYAHQE